MGGLFSCRRRAGFFALLLAFALGLAPELAQARTFAGVTMPDRMVVEGQTLQLNGMGVRSYTIFRVHGYVAGLYVPKPARDPGTILAAPGLKLVRIQFVHAAGLGRIQDEVSHSRAANCAAGCPKADDAAFAQYFSTIRAVKPGDTSTYIYGPDGVRVLFDGKLLATISNPDFARRMLEGMIGAHPPTTALRDGLLGLSAG